MLFLFIWRLGTQHKKARDLRQLAAHCENMGDSVTAERAKKSSHELDSTLNLVQHSMGKLKAYMKSVDCYYSQHDPWLNVPFPGWELGLSVSRARLC